MRAEKGLRRITAIGIFSSAQPLPRIIDRGTHTNKTHRRQATQRRVRKGLRNEGIWKNLHPLAVQEAGIHLVRLLFAGVPMELIRVSR